jgi:signal transduction histidine kinase/pSer/pThr/pTyr-binding forkhead associated (FHA) protein
MASLFVIRGRDTGQHYELLGSSTTLGRESTNQIQLHDTEVSRHHARVERGDDGQWTLVDLGSSNGSFINSARVTSQILASGDRVQLGSTLMIFSASSDVLHSGGPLGHEAALQDVAIVRGDDSRDDLSQIRRALAPGLDVTYAMEATSAGQEPQKPASSWDVMYQVGQAITRTLDIDEMMRQVLDSIFQWVRCDCGCVMLFDEVTGHLTPAYRRNRKTNNAQRPLEISKTILDYVLTRREGVLTSNAQSDARWTGAGSIVSLGIHEAMCVPMQGRYGVVGAIYVDTSTSPGVAAERAHVESFTEENLKLLIAIGNQAALAIEDTQFYRATLQAERMAAMGQTIANLSHHVKNILQGVRGGSYLIETGLNKQDFEVARKGWRIVERNQERISNLVMDMLSFSKERVPELREGDVRLTVNEVVELMQVCAEEVNAKLIWNPPTHFPPVRFDPDAMHRAVLNVVTNAIDAVESREGGEVRLSLQIDPDSQLVELSIEDNGEGISPENLERIFSVFESKKGARGTGLGLPVSRKILREHGGDVLVSSQPGQGTRFTLRWPGVTEGVDRPTMI